MQLGATLILYRLSKLNVIIKIEILLLSNVLSRTRYKELGNLEPVLGLWKSQQKLGIGKSQASALYMEISTKAWNRETSSKCFVYRNLNKSLE